MDAAVPAAGPGGLQAQAHAELGSRSFDHRFRRPLLLRQADRGAGRTWEDLPSEIRETYDRLGIPEAEKKFLAGVGAQYDSEIVYHNLKADLEKKGKLNRRVRLRFLEDSV
ncbi:MAG: hypothetical protein HC888_13995 [Candidatus Competibacteraceae bacterium]|nr:hypothetical protein [Candidatus Competibacteraceae bacterium]